MSEHNVTIDGPLKYIISENDTVNVMIMKVYLAIQMLRIFKFGIKALSLYVIYNVVLKTGFKNIPKIKYMQFFILLVSIEMVKHVMYDNEKDASE